MEHRERRLAENEALFREVNERVEAIARMHGQDDHIYEFYCECSNVDCTLHVPATIAEYEAVRAHPSRFLVFPSHDLPDIERVVDRAERFWVIEKVGEAGELVAELDPRSD